MPTVIAYIPAGVATAIHNGELNQESTSTDNVVTYNPFAVTINQAAGQDDPTSAWPILFDVEFSEPVNGFTAADVVVSGTAGATECEVTGSGAAYTVSVLNSPLIVGSVTHGANLDGAAGVAVAGNYAYVACFDGDRLTVVDISTPATPTIVGTVTDTSLNGAVGVAVDGNYCYVAVQSANRLTVVDISNPTAPFVAGSVNNPGSLLGAVGIVKDGNYCYVACTFGDRLTVVDVSTPSAPTIVGSVQHGTTLNGAWDVVKSGNYCYVTATSDNRLVVVDVSTPSAPSIVGSVQNATTLSAVRGITLFGSYAIVGAVGSTRVTTVDISIPTSPTIVGSAFTSERLWDVVVSNGDVYGVASNDSVFTKVDISTITAPTEVSTLRDDNFGIADPAIATAGSYVCTTSFTADSLVVIQVVPNPGTVIATIPAGVATSAVTGTPNPPSTSTDNVVTYVSAPSAISYINTVSLAEQPWGIAIYGSYALVTCGGANDRVLVLDLTTPALPVVIGTVINNVSLNTPRDIAIYGSDRAVAACFSSGRAALIGFDVPTVPQIRDTETGFTGPLGMAVGGDHAYMADQSGNSIVSLDLSVVDNITTADTLTHAWIADPSSVSIEGTIAAVPNESSLVPRLNLIDISDPTNLSIIGSISDANLDSGFDVRLRDNIAWVCAYGGSSPMNAVDCADPTTPVLVGTLLGSGIGIAFTMELYVTAAGTFPIVSDFTSDEVNLIDGRDPTAMTVIGTSSVGAPATIRRMAVYQNYVYVIESLGGSLRVLEIT